MKLTIYNEPSICGRLIFTTMKKIKDKKLNAVKADVDSGSLPLYDVEELNEIVTKFNNKEMTLFDFVGRVWNKAYTLGCVDGSKGNDR